MGITWGRYIGRCSPVHRTSIWTRFVHQRGLSARTPRRNRSASHMELCESGRRCPASPLMAPSNRVSTPASMTAHRCSFRQPSCQLESMEETFPNIYKYKSAKPVAAPVHVSEYTAIFDPNGVSPCHRCPLGIRHYQSDTKEIKSEVTQTQPARGSSNHPGYPCPIAEG